MKRLTGILAFSLSIPVAVLAVRAVMVTGAGIGIDPDQSTAHSSADSQAQTNVQDACPGTVTSNKKIFDQCSQADGVYVCNVNYTAICQLGN